MRRHRLLPLLAVPFVHAVWVAPAAAQTWMEFSVSGTVSVSERVEDTMLCSKTEDGLLGQGGMDWVIEFEAPSAAPATHTARFRVSAPASVTALHDDDDRTDDRLTGEGSITVESAGAGQMNIPLLKIAFKADGLSSRTGATLDLTGTMICPVF